MAWTVLTDAQLTANRPGTQSVFRGLRDNVAAAFAKDAGAPVLANNYVVSAMIAAGAVGQAQLAAAAVGQAQLKTNTGTVSTTTSDNFTLPGGQYGFYPQVRQNGTGTMNAQIASGLLSGSFITNIQLVNNDTAGSAEAQQRHVTASPPYESYRANDPVPRFIFCLLEIVSGKIISGYDAEDPPWANNGPTVINPMGRLQALMRSRLVVTPEQVRTTPGLRAQYESELADLWGFLHNPASAAAIGAEMERTFTQAEKNADMALIPHPFSGVNLVTHRVVVLNPTDDQFCRGLAMRALMGDSVLECLHNGYFTIDNTPMPGLVTPPGVMAVRARWKLT